MTLLWSAAGCPATALLLPLPTTPPSAAAFFGACAKFCTCCCATTLDGG